jgi:uncharacterized protein (UPF0262 family)
MIQKTVAIKNNGCNTLVDRQAGDLLADMNRSRDMTSLCDIT